MHERHRELLSHLRDALKAVRLFKQRTAPRDTVVPAGALGVLAAITASRGSHVKELAAASALDPSTISRAVAALVRDGLVERTADPADGRACVLTSTDAGRAAYDQVLDRYGRGLADALRGWTPDELRTFSTLLHRFTDDLLEAAR
ncbi:MarR family winged helix-turn-helix transcriptional regulator [Actinoplanes sp. CA-030573]|uniref:MarR family winged helix-turn-helix transcriptional regulator n=1 Tax=Actinoplanes sp. CA-030573 TaxID=3239898 RepID=UPI003D92E146